MEEQPLPTMGKKTLSHPMMVDAQVNNKDAIAPDDGRSASKDAIEPMMVDAQVKEIRAEKGYQLAVTILP
jgi:hypothetical protein